jgi:hypothetical protein
VRVDAESLQEPAHHHRRRERLALVVEPAEVGIQLAVREKLD